LNRSKPVRNRSRQRHCLKTDPLRQEGAVGDIAVPGKKGDKVSCLPKIVLKGRAARVEKQEALVPAFWRAARCLREGPDIGHFPGYFWHGRLIHGRLRAGGEK